MWTDGQGFFYFGDCRTGDRAATTEEIAARQPDLKAVINGQIAQLLALAGVSQGWHLDAMMAGMVALASTQGLTETQLYEVNPGYKQVKDVSEQIKALEAQL